MLKNFIAVIYLIIFSVLGFSIPTVTPTATPSVYWGLIPHYMVEDYWINKYGDVMTGDLYLVGGLWTIDATAERNIVLGIDKNSSVLQLNTKIAGDIVPNINNRYDIGDADLMFRNLYCLYIYGDSLFLTGDFSCTEVRGNLVPDGMNMYNLGSNMSAWNKLYVNETYTNNVILGASETSIIDNGVWVTEGSLFPASGDEHIRNYSPYLSISLPEYVTACYMKVFVKPSSGIYSDVWINGEFAIIAYFDEENHEVRAVNISDAIYYVRLVVSRLVKTQEP